MRWTDLWPSMKKYDEEIAPRIRTSDEVVDSKVDSAKHKDSSSELSDGTDLKHTLTSLDLDLAAFTEPRTLIPTVVLTTAFIGLYALYRSYLRRIPAVGNINPNFFRRRSLFGKVTSVGDGDNFRIYHTPGGWLMGWGWLPWRQVPQDKRALRNQTVHVRLAGIDAPEASHFGRPAQPHSQEALDWLTSYLLGRRVRAYLYKADQYGRVVATVYVWKRFIRRDVGLQMLKAGMATVYEAKTGAEYGVGLEEKYRKAEWWAKLKRKGMWVGNKKDFESPREYKIRFAGGSPPEDPVGTKK